jgi:hypothetical protein
VKPYEIEWEADSKNSNGILVWLYWDGYIIGNHPSDFEKPKTQPNRAMFVQEDDGKATLPDSFFEDIPKGAYVSINVNKGNIKLLDSKIDGSVKTIKLSNRSITDFFQMF